MSGTYKPKNGYLYFPKHLNKNDMEVINEYFDLQCDAEVQELQYKDNEENMLRSMCWVKILSFPLYYPLARIFLGKILAQDTWVCTKLYIKYLRKKINTETLKKELITSLKKVKGSIL